jgi:hypothetical protein
MLEMRHAGLHNRPVTGSLVALDSAQRSAETLLGERFAQGLIDDQELEARIDRVLAAVDAEGVEAVVADLLDPGTALVPIRDEPASTTALARPGEIREVARHTTWFGEQSQRGVWVPGRLNETTLVFGEGTYDLREARLGPGVTEFRLNVVLGEFELIVPPRIPVDVDCTVVLGSVKHDEPSHAPDASGPRIRVTGRVILGEVSIREREPGESKRQARKRRRQARRLARAERKSNRKALRPSRRDD